MKLDIGCGQNKKKGFVGVDMIPGPNVDIVWDLEEYPWEPIKDNSVDEVYISHYAEHTKDLMKFMDEIWRVCTNGAKITIISPYYTSIRAWQDPTHTRVISEATWMYFDKDWREANKIDHYPIKSNFGVDKMIVFFNPPWDKKSDEAKKFAQEHYWNAVSDMMTELHVIKEY